MAGGKTTPIAWGSGKNFGEHRCEMFDLEEEDCRKEYSELRTKSNDAGSGVSIERVREIIKTEVEVTTEDHVRTEKRSDHVLLFVEWWEKKTIAKGEADEAPDWKQEKPVGPTLVAVPGTAGGDGN